MECWPTEMLNIASVIFIRASWILHHTAGAGTDNPSHPSHPSPPSHPFHPSPFSILYGYRLNNQLSHRSWSNSVNSDVIQKEEETIAIITIGTPYDRLSLSIHHMTDNADQRANQYEPKEKYVIQSFSHCCCCFCLFPSNHSPKSLRVRMTHTLLEIALRPVLTSL